MTKAKAGTLRRILLRVVRAAVCLFYDKRYLRGRYFEETNGGWYWAVRGILFQKLLGFNRHIPWPVGPFIVIHSAKNLHFYPDDLNNFQTFGCYYQNRDADIYLGKGVYVAPNVGFITANHDPANTMAHLPGEDIVIGDECWIGMNSVILPGVTLGPRTTVGAGSVVTRSFPEGSCIIAGTPARLIKLLEPVHEAR